mmetsp:Transcript_18612/g.52617  ORF Transcript_18612/g.52617 Transcript_18612/m.52617 type:complete len:330 (+) Transcript_18612:27-1016(+)
MCEVVVEDKESYDRVVQVSDRMVIVRMRPSFVRYTQNSCSPFVRTGHDISTEPIDNCIERILVSKSKFEDRFDIIQCFTLTGDVFSLDNRRLFIACVLERKGQLTTIPVKLYPFQHEQVQHLRGRLPHWLTKASTTNRGDFITVNSKFNMKNLGCEDFGFTRPVVVNREDVRKAKMWKKHERQLQKFNFENCTNKGRLMKQILSRIARHAEADERRNYGDFVHQLVEELLDAKSAYDELAHLGNYLVGSIAEVLMTVPTSSRIRVREARRGIGGALGHATSYNIRLGFRGHDEHVEIFAWRDEECPDSGSFQRGCDLIRMDLQACYTHV